MPFTFGDLKRLIRDDVFPHYEGEAPFEADNLIARHNNAIVDGMIDLQRWVRCLRSNHVNVYSQCSTLFNCGASVVDAPRGIIDMVYTVDADGDCNEINYEASATYGDWKDYLGGTCPFTLPDQTGLPTTLPRGYLYPQREDPRLPRASMGRYVIENHRLYVAPRIQDFEKLIVNWNGVKLRWTDEDLLAQWWLDEDGLSVRPTIRRALAAFLESDMQRRDECNLEKAAAALVLFNDIRADLCYDCARETQPHLWRSSRVPLRRMPPTFVSPEEEEDADRLIFAIISDYGHLTNGVNNVDVADMVKSWDPDLILTAGDNQYGAPADYQAKVGVFYGDYITSELATNRFWPALGNHDWVDAGIQAYYDFFTLPNNERYYTIFKSPVEFFIIDSDQHEPDGVSVSSLQGEWLRIHLQLSQAPWKVVIFQDAPFTAGTDSPGNLWMRWNTFKAWGAHVVINGDTHGYERFHTVDTFPYLVAGTGGAPLVALGGLIDDENLVRSYARISTYGALHGQATCDQLQFQFRSIDGNTYDTLTFDRDANGVITMTELTHPDADIVGIIGGGGGVIVGEPGGPIVVP